MKTSFLPNITDSSGQQGISTVADFMIVVD
jgi:hypothetical protein